MSSRFSTATAAISLASVAALTFQTAASAQESQPGNPGQGSERCAAATGNYPPAEGPAVSDNTVQPGQRITATSGCREFAPGQRVAFGIVGPDGVFRELGSVIADAEGRAVATFTVPAGLAVGSYSVAFRGPGFNGGTNTVSIPISLVAATGAAPATGTPKRDTVTVGGVQLPRTGSDELVPLLALGAGLVVAGAGTVVVARRRRSEAVPTA